MASHAPDFGRASALPLAAVLSSARSYPRPILERLVARLIDHLDQRDGDIDVELSGDEFDTGYGEDEDTNVVEYMVANHLPGFNHDGQAGCPISDPPEDNGDAEPDQYVGRLKYGKDQRLIIRGAGPGWSIDA